ncbi:MAG: hypothetical protein E6G94_15665 [Alphaproteobacteria bacterium]|nr:MAG: hypothetical protein E6G94_15665 [Alphaproteobacteria bacterium]
MTLRLLLLLGAGALPAAAGAQVAPVTRSVPVTASAPPVCAIREPIVAAGGQINFRGLNGNTLQIDHLVDPHTLAAAAASVNITFDAVCNYPHRLILEAQNNGLWQTSQRPPDAPPGFAYAVPYTATIDWGVEHGRLEADAKVRRIADRSILVDHPTSGEITIRLEIDAGASNTQANAPLLAGSYGDTLRITLEPQ